MLGEIFRQGTLEMSSTPYPDIASGQMWDMVLTNRVAVAFAVLLFLLCFKDIILLFPHLMYAVRMSRGGVTLEHSLSMARIRNTVALVHVLPFCLMADRFALYRPAFWQLIPAEWSLPATILVFGAFLLLRTLCFQLSKPRRLSSEQASTVRRCGYNYFILLTWLMLLTIGVTGIFAPDPVTVKVILLCETAFAFLLSILQSTHFLGGLLSRFTTFLYLCTFEIMPAAVVVASAILF